MTSKRISRDSGGFVGSYDLFRWHAYAARGGVLCAYLVALAGFQRGLNIVFHTETKDRVSGKYEDFGGSVFSVSDGMDTVYFNRTRGEGSHKESLRSISKQRLSETLALLSVPHPKTCILEKSSIDSRVAELTYSEIGSSRLVVKPVGGSGGKGVCLGVASTAALVAAVRAQRTDKVVVQQEVRGTEYRVYVVGKEAVAVTLREPSNVVGDGRATIAELVRRKNVERKTNPHLASRRIKLEDEALALID